MLRSLSSEAWSIRSCSTLEGGSPPSTPFTTSHPRTAVNSDLMDDQQHSDEHQEAVLVTIPAQFGEPEASVSEDIDAPLLTFWHKNIAHRKHPQGQDLLKLQSRIAVAPTLQQYLDAGPDKLKRHAACPQTQYQKRIDAESATSTKSRMQWTNVSLFLTRYTVLFTVIIAVLAVCLAMAMYCYMHTIVGSIGVLVIIFAHLGMYFGCLVPDE